MKRQSAVKLIRGPAGTVERVHVFDGRIATRMKAKIRAAFIVAAKGIQGRRVHRPAVGESLWVAGSCKGLTARTVCGRWLTLVNTFEVPPAQFELCETCLIDGFPGPVLYRCLDRDGEVLYIGCSTNMFARVQNLRLAGWWHRVADVRYEVFPDHESALYAEQMAILTEEPPCNRDLTERTGNRGRRRGAFAHLITVAARAGPP